MRNITDVKKGEWLRYDFNEHHIYIHVEDIKRVCDDEHDYISITGRSFTCTVSGDSLERYFKDNDVITVSRVRFGSTVVVSENEPLNRFLEIVQCEGLNFFCRDRWNGLFDKVGKYIKFKTPEGWNIIIKVGGVLETTYTIDFKCDLKIVMKPFTDGHVEFKRNTFVKYPKEWFKNNLSSLVEVSEGEFEQVLKNIIKQFYT